MGGEPRLFGVTVNAPDVDEAAVFYRDVLGLPLSDERHGDGPKHYHAGWNFPDGGLMLTLWPGEAVPQSLDFIVADVAAVHTRAIAKGVEVLQEPGSNDVGAPAGWKDCSLRDPVGNRVRVYQAAR